MLKAELTEPFSEQKQTTILATSRILFCELTHEWFQNSFKLLNNKRAEGCVFALTLLRFT